ncbi:hypothetical protein BH11BAC2_BH11BAC2_14720 [soil metagenome]
MSFRLDIDEFPFYSRERGVWYFVVDWESKSETPYSIVQDKHDLVKLLQNIIAEKNAALFQLYGVWTGQYRTDIFKIPIEIGYNKLKEHFSE